jgi:hypothetical protein
MQKKKKNTHTHKREEKGMKNSYLNDMLNFS